MVLINLKDMKEQKENSMYKIKESDSEEVKSLKEAINLIDSSSDIRHQICGAAQDFRYECISRLKKINKTIL
jgi:hypothetical protein